MLKSILLTLSILATLSACATTTPIAVSTPQWQVPAVPAALQSQEQAAQAKAKTSLANWDSLVSRLPTASATSTQH